MTPRQVAIVQNSWSIVSASTVYAAEVFYRRLFEINPSVRGLFPSDLDEQKRALMEMLNIVINGLEMFEEIRPDVEELGWRHAGYNVDNGITIWWDKPCWR